MLRRLFLLVIRCDFTVQFPRGNTSRQGTDARLRCLAAQAAASVLSKASKVANPIGVPEVSVDRYFG